MPLPLIPIVLGAASLAAGAFGVKKGLDAKKTLEQAESIGRRAECRHRQAVEELDKRRKETFTALQKLGKKKADVFINAGRAVVDLVKQAQAQAKIPEYELLNLPIDELPSIEKAIGQIESLELTLGLGKGLGMAALGAAGIYGAVGAFGTASTGTAIASLSGAAATNATLAWLGGGSLAAGGLGVAGGTWVLGGVVTGPALAIAGFALASKAEEALTKAEEYAAEIEKKIAALAPVWEMLAGLNANIQETHKVLDRLNAAFYDAKANYLELANSRSWKSWWKSLTRQKEKELEERLLRVIAIFKAIKAVVQTPLFDEQGMPVVGLAQRYAKLLVSDVPALPAKGENA